MIKRFRPGSMLERAYIVGLLDAYAEVMFMLADRTSDESRKVTTHPSSAGNSMNVSAWVALIGDVQAAVLDSNLPKGEERRRK